MFETANQTLNVIDPCNRTGKIEIPMAHITETKGVTDWIRHGPCPPPDAKDLSLCLLHQRGRCNAGGRCNQVHASPEYVESLRRRASAGKPCCAKHGDVHSTELLTHCVTHVVVTSDACAQRFAVTDFALTESLELAIRRARDNVARVSSSRICRLHQKGSCKFGKDCKNIHLCGSAVPSVPQLKSLVVGEIPKVHSAVSLGISNRSSLSKTGGDESGYTGSLLNPLCGSVLSEFDEFNSIRKNDLDPLDILDNDSSFSDATAWDFDAFVDALVECGPDTLASPSWIAS